MDRLIVKNFGPLKDIDIELNKINLFIGENGSGKSVLAKLIVTILNLIRDTSIKSKGQLEDTKLLEDNLKKYHINFLSSKTYIHYFDCNKQIYSIMYKNSKVIIENKVLEKEKEEFNSSPYHKSPHIVTNKENFLDNISEVLSQNNKLTAQYIPAERNLISIFNKYVTTFITADIPLPKFLLNFSSQYIRAREEIGELNLLDVKYKFENDKEHIYYNDKDYLLLEHSSSGIQSALPLHLTVKYFAQKYRGIIIEEPEQNLFPKAQSETIRYIIEQVSDKNNLFMMTHSPYVLSVLNILIFAHKVAQMNEDAKKKVEEFVKKEYWINPDNFSAYYLKNGIAKDIKSSRGLISDNEIDDISEDIAGEFDELMEIYREFKDAK